MQEKIYIYLAVSVAGIFLLLFLSFVLQPKLVKIEGISENLINQKVKINGEVIGEKNFDGFVILTIKDETGEIQATCNCKQELKGKQVEIVGRITEYNRELQIQADKIVEKSN